jgi:hypothetical protein
MVVVVYRKSERSKTKYMTVFLNEQNPDRIINGRARKPLIPDEYIIDEIGVGENFINEYKKHHKIKKHESVE